MVPLCFGAILKRTNSVAIHGHNSTYIDGLGPPKNRENVIVDLLKSNYSIPAKLLIQLLYYKAWWN